MIRIFITTILYLITMFTQAQEKSSDLHLDSVSSSIDQVDIKSDKKAEIQDGYFCRFQEAKFEVNNKDLTFEIR